MKSFLLLFVSVSAFAAEVPAYKWGDRMIFSVQSTEDENKPPFLRVFPGGKTKDGRDAEVLETLKYMRGDSELYPEEDAKPGYLVVVRNIALVPDKDKQYDLLFEGEFYSVRVDIPKDRMELLFAGKKTPIRIDSKSERGAVGIYYTIKTSTEFQLQLDGKNLLVQSVEAGCTIENENKFTGNKGSYTSATITEKAKKDEPYLFLGVPGKLAGLPSLAE